MSERVSFYKDWSQEDRERYLALLTRYRNRERLTRDEWDWFIAHHRANMAGYAMKSRKIRRRYFATLGERQTYGGLETANYCGRKGLQSYADRLAGKMQYREQKMDGEIYVAPRTRRLRRP